MGSVPMNKGKLFLITIIIEAIILSLAILTKNTEQFKALSVFLFIALITGPIFYGVKSSKYRNAGARHTYERETKQELTNVIENDKLIDHETELTSSSMLDANNDQIYGEYTKIKEEK